jgi:hypothetical protein
MKTVMTVSSLPSTKMIFVYVAAVFVFCILNCLVLSAQGYDGESATVNMDPINNFIGLEPESELLVQDWMLNFSSPESGNVNQSRISVNHPGDEHLKAVASKSTPVVALKNKNPEKAANTLNKASYLLVE